MPVLLLIISILTVSFAGASASATGFAELIEVPVGYDSLFQTSVVGVNDSPEKATFKVSIIKTETTDFFESVLDRNWLEPESVFVSAPPFGNTNPIKIRTHIPMDSTFYNRRFVALISLEKASKGNISMGVAIPAKIETNSSRAIFSRNNRLTLAPSRAILKEIWDSVLIRNGSSKPETLNLFFSEVLSISGEKSDAVELYRRFLMWRIPVSRVVLNPNQGEWVFFRKKENSSVRFGFIICATKNFSLYCNIEPGE